MKKLFQKLFRHQEMKASGEISTIPLPVRSSGEEKGIEQSTYSLDVPQLSVGCSQSVGKQRVHNEDALLTITATLACNGEYLPFGFFIVADGMGGHKFGEVASNLAVRSIANQIVHKVLMTMLSPQPTAPSESIQEILESSVQEAHQRIQKEVPESGSTLTALLILDQQMSLAHVGDSRAYQISPDGDMQLLTHDHTLVMRMMELGQLTMEEAAVHPQRNVLYRAIGHGDDFSPDISTSPVPNAGYVLLCSDGLWGVVPQEEISNVVINSPNPQLACQRLIDAANDAGGPDNISAILVRIPDLAM